MIVFRFCVFFIFFIILSACTSKETEAYKNVEFVSFKEWDKCVSANVCSELSLSKNVYSREEPVRGISHSDAVRFLIWYNTKRNGSTQMLTAKDLSETFSKDSNESVFKHLGETGTWLKNCRVSPDFEYPSSSRLKVFGYPKDWPYKMNSAGQVCKKEVCYECSFAFNRRGKIRSVWIFSDASSMNSGLLVNKK